MARNTTKVPELEKVKVEDFYPAYKSALRSAGYHTESPTFNEIWQRPPASRQDQKAKNYRNIFFCVGFSECFKIPIHVILKKLLIKHGLNWVRLRMSYHTFGNFSNAIIADVNEKLSSGLIAEEFKDNPCNCSGSQGCLYGGICRDRGLIYKVLDKQTGKFYVGNTIQNFKDRMKQHFSDVQSLFLEDKTKHKSDAFSRYFRTKFTVRPKPADLRDKISCSALWKASGYSFMRNFGRMTCMVCMQEKVNIVNLRLKYPNLILNCSDDIYAGCRHWRSTKFLTYKPRSDDFI